MYLSSLATVKAGKTKSEGKSGLPFAAKQLEFEGAQKIHEDSLSQTSGLFFCAELIPGEAPPANHS